MMNRLTLLKQQLLTKNLDALLVSSVPNIVYLTSYAGFSTDEREAFLLITKSNNYIITDGRYTEVVYKQVKGFTLLEKTATNPTSSLLLELVKKHTIQRLGFETHSLSVAEHIHLSKTLGKRLLIPTMHFIEQIRKMKTPDEIAAIAKACKLGDLTFDHIRKQIKEGISEKQLAATLEYYIKQQGGGIAFHPIVAFGNNASLPHHVNTDRPLKKGDFVLLDFGTIVDNYCSDMTRTLIYGKATEKQKHIYTAVLDAQHQAITVLTKTIQKQNTIQASLLDKTAREYIVSQGYPTMPHSLGHGIGIQVHETPSLSPKSQDMLTNGMVFSIEPGIYIPDYGGVRIEDLVIVEKNTIRLLTNSPRNLIELTPK